jgi:hypothetical protein
MRTSFHHQPEAQHPHSPAINTPAGRLPHLLHTNSGQILQRSEMTQCAKSRLLHRSKLHRYSITSSARQISVLGTLRPSALAAELPDPSSSAPRA